MLIIASEEQFGLVDGCDSDYLVAKERCGFRFDPVTGMLIGVAGNVDCLKTNQALFVDKLRITKNATDLYEATAGTPAKSGLILAYNATRKRFEVTFGSGASWKTDYLLVKENGFKFDGMNKIWHTKKKKIAAALQYAATPEALEVIGKRILERAPKPIEWNEAEARAMRRLQQTPEECRAHILAQGWMRREPDRLWIHVNEDEAYDTIQAIWRQREIEQQST
jgi:hypothetical protein